MNWALVWWKLTSSGGGDADDGVDSALGEPGSGGEFIVVGSQRMGVTLSRALQRVTRQFQIQRSLSTVLLKLSTTIDSQLEA